MFCFGIGGLVDRHGSRIVLTVLSLVLGAVVVGLSAVEGTAMLLVMITLTRGLGQSALSVIDAHPDRLTVVGLAAGENVDRLAEQIARYRPRVAAMGSGDALDRPR